MVINATLNNNSAISWRSALLVKTTNLSQVLCVVDCGFESRSGQTKDY